MRLEVRHMEHIARLIRAGNRVEQKHGRPMDMLTADNIVEYINEVLEDNDG